MNGSGAWRLLRMAATRRALLAGTLLAIAAELGGAALLGVSGWFLTTCAVVTLQANTTWSWMYPSGAVRTLAPDCATSNAWSATGRCCPHP
ncbi:hypothetical protein ACIOHC_38800 [Streptomyces sp. NPDC088252]|uniref:hypothetical protein n=1 Tax=unclassified Streptomyces TaxID=2593676 RepID=UPI003825BEEA